MNDDLQNPNPAVCSSTTQTIYVTQDPNGPTVVDLSRQAADPSAFDFVTLAGSNFRTPPTPSRVLFERPSVAPGVYFPAMGSNVVDGANINVTTPSAAGGSTSEDPGNNLSWIWVENPNGTSNIATRLPFAFTYAPIINSITGGPSVQLGTSISVTGSAFVGTPTDGASVIFTQGSTVIEEDPTLVTATSLTVLVPAGLNPGPAKIQVRKHRSYGLKDNRVSPSYDITVLDTQAPYIVDRYPTAATGASPHTEISVTVGDAGRGLQQGYLGLKLDGVTVPFSTSPDLPTSTTYYLRYKPPAALPGGSHVYTAQVTCREVGAATNTLLSYTFKVSLGVVGGDDNLPNDWESAHFGTTAYGDNDDPDNDGRTNLSEYNAGTNPDSNARDIAGPGGLPANPTRVLLYARSNSQGLLWSGLKSDAMAGFVPYSAAWGNDVAASDLDGDGFDEVVTGAGPGGGNTSQVRAFEVGGQSLDGVNFFAYPGGDPLCSTTLYKNGVCVSGARFENVTPGTEQILTSPGPGSPWGALVRGWKMNNGVIEAMPLVCFYAYQGGYGANVDRGNLDGDQTGFDEILTGAGPGGSTYAAQVKAFKFTPGQLVTAISKINFDAYPGVYYGVRVAGGDLDNDTGLGGFDEIVTGSGPNPSLTTTGHLKGWNYDNVSIGLMTGASIFPFDSNVPYGLEVASGGDLDNTSSDFGEDVLAMESAPRPEDTDVGTERLLGSQIRAYRYTGNSFATINTLDAFDTQGFRGGVKAAMGHFDGYNAVPISPFSSLRQLYGLRQVVAGIPDGSLPDDTLQMEMSPEERNEWQNPSIKPKVIEKLDALRENLPSLSLDDVATTLVEVENLLAGAFKRDEVAGMVRQQLHTLTDTFETKAMPSSSVVAQLTLADRPGLLFPSLDPRDDVVVGHGVPASVLGLKGATLESRPIADAWSNQAGDRSVSFDAAAIVPGGSLRTLGPRPVFVRVDRPCVEKPPTLPEAPFLAIPTLVCPQGTSGKGATDVVLSISDRPEEDRVVASYPCDSECAIVLATDIVVVPTGWGGEGSAFISVLRLDPSGVKPAIGEVIVVDGIDDPTKSSISHIITDSGGGKLGLPLQLALVGDPEKPRVCLATPSGIASIDVISRKVDAATISAAATGIAYDHEGNRLFSVDQASQELSVRDGTTGEVLAARRVDGGPARIALTEDRAFLVATIPSCNAVEILSPADLSTIRRVGVGRSPVGVATTRDSGFAFVGNGDDPTVSMVYLQRPHLAPMIRVVVRAIDGIPPNAYAGDPKSGKAELMSDLEALAGGIADAEAQGKGPARDAILQSLIDSADGIMAKMDGSFGGKVDDDVLASGGAQELVRPLLQEMSALLDGLIAGESGPK